MVKILSPSTRRNDLDRKFHLYEKFGVSEYWIVDPLEHRFEQFVLTDSRYSLQEHGQVVAVRYLAEVTVDLKQVW